MEDACSPCTRSSENFPKKGATLLSVHVVVDVVVFVEDAITEHGLAAAKLDRRRIETCTSTCCRRAAALSPPRCTATSARQSSARAPRRWHTLEGSSLVGGTLDGGVCARRRCARRQHARRRHARRRSAQRRRTLDGDARSTAACSSLDSGTAADGWSSSAASPSCFNHRRYSTQP